MKTSGGQQNSQAVQSQQFYKPKNDIKLNNYITSGGSSDIKLGGGQYQSTTNKNKAYINLSSNI